MMCEKCGQVLPNGTAVMYSSMRLWIPESHDGASLTVHARLAFAANAGGILWNDRVRLIIRHVDDTFTVGD